MTAEETRKEIAKEFRKLSDHKFLRGGLELALSGLEQLHERAHRDEVPQPWRALCAYRLAHVLMWSEKSENYERAHDLFLDAQRATCLGPWPHVYRLAAAVRCGQPLSSTALDAEFGRAIDELRRSRDGSVEDPRLQDDKFNLLELAAYFTGASLAPLSGRSELAGGRGEKVESFRVVTNDPISAAVACTRAVALEELEERSKAKPDALCFQLLGEDRDQSRWKLPYEADWKPVNHRWVRRLAISCANPGRPGAKPTRRPETVDRYVIGEREDGNGASRRKIEQRIRGGLGSLDLWDENGEFAIAVIGVVHWDTFSTPPDPR